YDLDLDGFAQIEVTNTVDFHTLADMSVEIANGPHVLKPSGPHRADRLVHGHIVEIVRKHFERGAGQESYNSQYHDPAEHGQPFLRTSETHVDLYVVALPTERGWTNITTPITGTGALIHRLQGISPTREKRGRLLSFGPGQLIHTAKALPTMLRSGTMPARSAGIWASCQ